MARKTAHQYLNDDIESIVDHLNQSTIPSEMPFVSAVLTARATLSYEKLAKKMIFLTRIMAIVAAIALIVPILFKIFDNNQSITTLKYQEERIKSLGFQIENVNLKAKITSDIVNENKIEYAESKKDFEKLRAEIRNLEGIIKSKKQFKVE
ncbi:MAG: hypothetical protein MUP71_10625 [Candidatus Aminicenantes bacterium]|nr:hypothetical protein [Candidatus Aminicenantes bacterium]